MIPQYFTLREYNYRRKITDERPLRLKFKVCTDKINSLEEESFFKNLSVSKKKNDEEKTKEETNGKKLQHEIITVLKVLDIDTVYTDKGFFKVLIEKIFKEKSLKIPKGLMQSLLKVFSESDKNGDVCTYDKGNLESNSSLRDTESIPLKIDINEYFKSEVVPYVPYAWINEDVKYRDHKDGRIGKVGYQINFNRYFYKYQPPRSLEEIESELKQIEGEILGLLQEVA